MNHSSSKYDWIVLVTKAIDAHDWMTLLKFALFVVAGILFFWGLRVMFSGDAEESPKRRAFRRFKRRRGEHRG
jgi:hypothetical protein